MIILDETRRLVLQREIRQPESDEFKFNDTTDLVPKSFSFAKDQKVMDVCFQMIQIAGANYEYGKNIIPR